MTTETFNCRYCSRSVKAKSATDFVFYRNMSCDGCIEKEKKNR